MVVLEAERRMVNTVLLRGNFRCFFKVLGFKKKTKKVLGRLWGLWGHFLVIFLENSSKLSQKEAQKHNFMPRFYKKRPRKQKKPAAQTPLVPTGEKMGQTSSHIKKKRNVHTPRPHRHSRPCTSPPPQLLPQAPDRLLRTPGKSLKKWGMGLFLPKGVENRHVQN